MICDECPHRELCSGPPWCEYAEWPEEWINDPLSWPKGEEQ